MLARIFVWFFMIPRGFTSYKEKLENHPEKKNKIRKNYPKVRKMTVP